MSKIELYFKNNIDTIDWPKTENAKLIQALIIPMMKASATDYIANIQTTLALLQINDKFLPLTINDTEYTSSYITSIYSFLSYADEEMQRHKKTFLRTVIKPFLFILSQWFKLSRINKTIIVNNHLLPTNLYTNLTVQEIATIHQYLKQAFPKHAILYRSINQTTEPILHQTLQSHQYQLITSRSVYLLDSSKFSHISSHKRRTYRIDKALIEKNQLQIVSHEELTPQDCSQMKKLYDQLYLDKYTYLNPQYTVQFFQNALKNKALHFIGIKSSGKLIAITGFVKVRNILTTPIVGYDTTLPKKLGLYRIITACTIGHTINTQTLFHMSAGAGHYKRQRGAKQAIEYSGVYTKHLPHYRQLPWHFLSILFNKIGKPILLKNKL